MSHIISRYKSIFFKGEHTFEDGPLEKLRVQRLKGDREVYLFDGSNSCIGIDSMRIADPQTEKALNDLDAQLADLRQRAAKLQKERRDLIAKTYPKLKKVYKWDLEKVS